MDETACSEVDHLSEQKCLRSQTVQHSLHIHRQIIRIQINSIFYLVLILLFTQRFSFRLGYFLDKGSILLLHFVPCCICTIRARAHNEYSGLSHNYVLLHFAVVPQDMTSRELLQQRTTLANGDTAWRQAPLVVAALEGRLAVLDGVHRLDMGTLSVLKRQVKKLTSLKLIT